MRLMDRLLVCDLPETSHSGWCFYWDIFLSVADYIWGRHWSWARPMSSLSQEFEFETGWFWCDWVISFSDCRVNLGVEIAIMEGHLPFIMCEKAGLERGDFSSCRESDLVASGQFWFFIPLWEAHLHFLWPFMRSQKGAVLMSLDSNPSSTTRCRTLDKSPYLEGPQFLHL